MEVIKEIVILVLIVLVTCLIYDWITLPWKVNRNNELLEEILKKLNNK
ncbi:hypothetical protein SAMN02745134_00272 [Clostridium acidisoli DSM 12555]|uniref:Uncharacterized protein n=1 Tax=Clostridium acidisoli DSM 12555 TaxID=1121291 RepID=A0A1W1X038_9CLOT|nr:hypothetical protein [Clostridium acidisoli]SMC17264.1 hypothetical protein SAMN02745134_00272 [Clostridium acidisoli DSM 12555]